MGRVQSQPFLRKTSPIVLAAMGTFVGIALGLVASPTLANPFESARGAEWPIAASLHPDTYRDLTRGGVVLQGPGGTRVRYRAARDHATPTSPVESGRAVADAAIAGLHQVYPWLHGSLGIDPPEDFEILLTDLNEHTGSRYWPPDGSGRPGVLLLHDSPVGGSDALRTAVIADYTRTIVHERLPGLPASWLESIANFAQIATTQEPSPAVLDLLSRRVKDLDQGLLSAPSVIDGGNALWLTFLEENFGIASVRATLHSLARNAASVQAMDNALRQSAGTNLADAFREFQVWTVLVGDRDDGQHFAIGNQLVAAPFASTERGLPALSVQSNPSVGAWGAVQIRLDPAESEGGLRLLFEGGEFDTAWQLDLLVNGIDGRRHRMEVPLLDGRGEISLPLQGADSIWLLVRNLGGQSTTGGRYTFAAHHEPDYPVDFAVVEVVANDAEPMGMVVSWNTESEEDLVGFSVLRRRGPVGEFQPVQGVWIPALGQVNRPTSYRLMDRSVDPEVSYEYRIQAITRWGLTVVSPIAMSPVSN